MFGFCNIATIPIRATASHRAEMVTQLLFGEAYRIVSYPQTAGWVEILTQYDDYKGFMDVNQIVLIHESSYEQYVANRFHVSSAQMTIFDKKRGFFFPISAGSTLLLNKKNEMRLGAEWFEIASDTAPNSSKEGEHALPFGEGWGGVQVRNDELGKSVRLTSAPLGNGYSLPKEQRSLSGVEVSPNETILKTIAYSFLNMPYLWGGRSIYGIDCSGFTQVVFKIIGKKLPRDASQQALVGEKITSLTETQCGDLAFFQNKDGRITHTGLILDKKTIIHASGKVRMDILDEQGVFCVERNEYSHRLQAIRRVL